MILPISRNHQLMKKNLPRNKFFAAYEKNGDKKIILAEIMKINLLQEILSCSVAFARPRRKIRRWVEGLKQARLASNQPLLIYLVPQSARNQVD